MQESKDIKKQLKETEKYLNLHDKIKQYREFLEKTRGFKKSTQYDPRHFENLERMVRVFTKLDLNLNELLTIPEDDYELETAGEYAISTYVDYLASEQMTAMI